jgi:hypothetical protein
MPCLQGRHERILADLYQPGRAMTFLHDDRRSTKLTGPTSAWPCEQGFEPATANLSVRLGVD